MCDLVLLYGGQYGFWCWELLIEVFVEMMFVFEWVIILDMLGCGCKCLWDLFCFVLVDIVCELNDELYDQGVLQVVLFGYLIVGVVLLLMVVQVLFLFLCLFYLSIVIFLEGQMIMQMLGML